jgi:hypothetical protein
VSLGLHVQPEAEREIAEVHAHYEAREPGLGGEFLDALDEMLVRICAAPAAYTPIAPSRLGLRVASLKRFPYRVIFFTTPAQVEIVAVAHAPRRQGYWRRRLS